MILTRLHEGQGSCAWTSDRFQRLCFGWQRFHKRKRLRQIAGVDFAGWTNSIGASEVWGGRHQPFVKFKAVFTHRERDDMLTSLFNVEENAERDAAMLLKSSLTIFPVPGVLAWAPLKPLAAGRPFAIEPDVQAVVFRA